MQITRLSAARTVERAAWPALAVVGAVILAMAALVPFAESDDPSVGIELRTIDVGLPLGVAVARALPTVAAIVVVATACVRLAITAEPRFLALGMMLGVGLIAFVVQVSRLLELSADAFLIPSLGAFLGPVGSGLVLIGAVLQLPRHLEQSPDQGLARS
ncbi:MAG TPA: hypothetical protein VG602_04265 [Actinomycetota bacterium]|nr:hypothetical protein [Actinomycetota bacterium]